MQRVALPPCGGLARSFGGALLLRQWGRIGTEGRRRLDPHPDSEQPSTRLPVAPDASDVVAIRIVAYDQIEPADWLCTTSWDAVSAAPNSPQLMPIWSAKNSRASPRDVVKR